MKNRQEVIQLVGIRQQDKRLYLTEEGKSFLQSIDGPVSIISIAGLYRTGKSFLVNELLQKLNHNDDNQKHKFQVGSTVQSCTKGLNVWGVPFQCKNSNKNFHYIIVDSQGIGSMEQQYSYDINLLMLIFLISSTVIYNSIGAIDEQSLDQLRVIVNLKKSFLTGHQNSQPRFIWVLRDFALQLINKKGQSLTSNQYLEDCLQCTNSTNKQIIKKNEIRQAIKSCLPNRECITFVRPTIKQEQLQNLHSLPKNKLRQQFNQQIDTLFETVFRNQQGDIKYLNDTQNSIDGPTLCQMIEYYLSEINCNKIPQIKSVWQLIQSTKLDLIFQQCESQFKRQVMKITLSGQDEQVLKQRLNQIQQFIYEKYQKQLPKGDSKIHKQFFTWFHEIKQKIWNKILKTNRQVKKKKTLKFIRDYINKHIEFDKIDPCALTQVKQVIQGLNLKEIAQLQAYDYILTTIFDILQIAQQKTIRIKDDLALWQQSKKQTQMQKNTKDQQLIKLKQTYHQALREISLLKSSSVSDKQNLQVLKQQFVGLEEKCRIITKQKLQKQEELRVKIDQLNEKIRRKHEQTAQSMKFLRTQNQALIQQLQEAKKQLNDHHMKQRKQLIFQDKIKQSWDRFEQQRAYFKKQLSKFKELYHESQEKLRTLTEKEQKLQNILRKQRDVFGKKERQFCQQLKWMKENYSKTKQAYNQSLNTRIQSERILQDVTVKKKNVNNVIMNQSRMSILNNNSEVIVNNNSKIMTNSDEKNVIDQLTLKCEEMKREKEDLLKQIDNLQKEKITLDQKINNLITKLQLQQKNTQQIKSSYQKRLQKLQEQNHILQSNNETQKQRFYSCLKQLQESKQQQRKMYEQSIMRLLNNIEGLEPTKIKPKMSVQKKSSTTLGQTNKLNKKYLY